jgi:hypothetical protein
MGVLKGPKTTEKMHENQNESMEMKEEGSDYQPGPDGMKNDGPELPQSTPEKLLQMEKTPSERGK